MLHLLRVLLAHGVPVGDRRPRERSYQHVRLTHVELAERRLWLLTWLRRRPVRRRLEVGRGRRGLMGCLGRCLRLIGRLHDGVSVAVESSGLARILLGRRKSGGRWDRHPGSISQHLHQSHGPFCGSLILLLPASPFKRRRLPPFTCFPPSTKRRSLFLNLCLLHEADWRRPHHR